MRRVVALFALGLVLAVAGAGPVVAQEEGFDPRFSNTILGTLGYPEIAINVTPDGFEAPTTLAADHYLVTLSAARGQITYVDFMQPPAGLDEAEMTELALAAARDDLVQPGWGYAGGSNLGNPDVPVSFIIRLDPGEYQIAASIYAPEQGSAETMFLSPLTVTAAAATPTATPGAGVEPPSTVTLEMTDDLRYVVSPDPVPAGPQVWKIANTGTELAHHVVMFRTEGDATADGIIAGFQADFAAMASGTPFAGPPPTMAQFEWVGYAALQSGGATTYAEFDLDPATYAVICFIVDPVSQQPHFLAGMVTVFTVE